VEEGERGEKNHGLPAARRRGKRKLIARHHDVKEHQGRRKKEVLNTSGERREEKE